MLASHSNKQMHHLLHRYVGAAAVSLIVCVIIVWWVAGEEWSTIFPTSKTDSPTIHSATGQLNPVETISVAREEIKSESRLSDTTKISSQANSFQAALELEDYATAVSEYDYLYTSSGVDESDVYRQKIINHASSLIQNRETQKAIELLQTYLAFFYNDVDALFTLGRAYRNETRWFEAIQTFQQSERYAYQATNIRVIRGQLNYAIGFYVQELKEQQKSDEVIELFQYLTQSQPETPRYFIGLANAYSDQRRYGEAIDSLRYIQNNFEVGVEARSMIKKLTQLQASWLNISKP